MPSLFINDIEGIGTKWIFEFFQNVDIPATKVLLTSEINDFEQKYSRFIDSSLVTKLNNNRLLNNPPVDLTAMLLESQKWYKISSGIFNILLQKNLSSIGYDKNYSFIESQTHHKIGNPVDDIIITDSTITLLGDANIDLGGIGKGYLIDKLARVLISKGISYFVINGGGDIFGTSDNDSPIEVLFQSPDNPQNYFAKTTILNESFCSSSPFVRAWITTNTSKQFNHLINPKNPDLITKFQSFTKSNSATNADILATIIAISPSFFVENSISLELSTIDYQSMVITQESKIISSNILPITFD